MDVLKRITKSGFKRPIIISADKNGGLREQAIKFEAVISSNQLMIKS